MRFSRLTSVPALATLALLSVATTAHADNPYAARFIAATTISNTQTATDTNPGGANFLVGGISGLTYAGGTTYYGIEDNQGAPPVLGVNSPSTSRFYTINLNITSNSISASVTSATSLTAPGVTLTNGTWDGESIALAPGGTTFFAASENDPNAATPNSLPTIREFNVSNGAQVGSPVAVPSFFQRDAGSTQGVRGNLAFESLALSADGNTLYVANEQALLQDGGQSSSTSGTTVRILRYTRANNSSAFILQGQFAYLTDRIPVADAGAGSDRGLTELRVLPGGDLLALERSFVTGSATGNGNYIGVYQVALGGATQFAPGDSTLTSGFTPVTKRNLLTLTPTTPGFAPDNIESMTIGPTLADGSLALILGSDNNFSGSQTTQFAVFALSTAPEPTPIAFTLLPLLGIGIFARHRK